jgi:hypothetical protein
VGARQEQFHSVKNIRYPFKPQKVRFLEIQKKAAQCRVRGSIPKLIDRFGSHLADYSLTASGRLTPSQQANCETAKSDVTGQEKNFAVVAEALREWMGMVVFITSLESRNGLNLRQDKRRPRPRELNWFIHI